MSPETTPAGIRLPDWLWSDIDAEAHRLGTTRNELVERTLAKHIPAGHKVPALPGFLS